MKRLQIPSLLAAVALWGALARGQAPTPAAGGNPPATTPPATTTPPAAGTTATTTGAAAAKPKPFSSGDIQKIKDLGEALEFNLKMGETAKWKGKDDKELAELGTRINKEAVDYYTPFATLAQNRGVASKDIPSAMSTTDKNNLERVNKAKPDKWKMEFIEFFAKEAKKNAHSVDAAAKAITDPELKELATKAAKMFSDQSDTLEKMYKEMKSPKKEAKK